MILDEATDSLGRKYLLVLISTLNEKTMIFEEAVHRDGGFIYRTNYL